MSHTRARIFQYIVIILILVAVSGAGYALYQSRAAVTQKAASKNGLVGYWNFEENTGTAAGDMSGSGNAGTLTNGPTWVNGRSGKAVDLDGSNDYVTMGSPALYDDMGPLTISMWINPDSVSASPRLLMGKVDAGASTGWWVGQSGSGTGKLFIQAMFSSGTMNTRSANDVLVAGKWQHLVFTFDGTSTYANQHIYLNGTEVAYDTGASNNGAGSYLSDAALNLNIGRDATTGSYIYGGLMDEARLYDRVLSAAEVAAIYGAGIAEVSSSQTSSLTNGLAGIWSFDGADISGTTAYDRSANANNGTLTNGPAVVKGKVGQALNFDGSNDYVTVGSPASLDDIVALSTCAWIYPETMPASASYMEVVEKTSTNDGWEFLVYNNGGEFLLGLFRNFSTSDGAWFADTIIPLNQWTYACFSYDRSSASNDPAFYINGAPITATEYYTPSGTVNSDAAAALNIGAYNATTARFDGPIDEVRVYNRILSADEVWSLYQLGAADKVNAADASSESLERGLAAYWKLDENTGTSAADASVSGKTGTLTNSPTWGAGRIGSGVTLDGTNDYIDIGSSSALADNLSRFSVSTWFKTSTTTCPSANCMLISKLSTGSFSTGIGWALLAEYNYMGQLGFLVQGPTSSDWVAKYTDADTYDDGAWHHVLATYDSGTIIMYVDGSTVYTTTNSGGTIGSISNAVNVRIGADTDGNYFPGTVDEVRIYDRVLSAEEAAKLYKTSAPDDPDTGLKAYYPFNGPDISGTTAYDRSGAGNNGTLTNGPVAAIGKIGQGLNFDGTDDYVETASQIDVTGSKTVSFWMKADTLDANNRRIFYSSNGTANDYLIVLSWDGYVAAVVDNVYSAIHRITSSPLSTGQWYHVAITKTTNQIGEIYINGAAAGTVQSDYTTDNETATYIGGHPYQDGFDGTIDDVRVYGRVLTATEITALYNQGK